MLKRSRDIYLLAEAAVMAHDVIVEVAAIAKLEDQIELRLRIYHLVKSDHVRMLHQLHASHLRTQKQKRMMIGHGGMQRGGRMVRHLPSYRWSMTLSLLLSIAAIISLTLTRSTSSKRIVDISYAMPSSGSYAIGR